MITNNRDFTCYLRAHVRTKQIKQWLLQGRRVIVDTNGGEMECVLADDGVVAYKTIRVAPWKRNDLDPFHPIAALFVSKPKIRSVWQ